MGTRLAFRFYSYMYFVIAPSGIEPHLIDNRQDLDPEIMSARRI